MTCIHTHKLKAFVIVTTIVNVSNSVDNRVSDSVNVGVYRLLASMNTSDDVDIAIMIHPVSCLREARTLVAIMQLSDRYVCVKQDKQKQNGIACAG